MHVPNNFETERLVLRPTTIKDSEFIFKLLNTPKWLEFIGDRNVHSVEDAKKYIQNKMYPQLHKLGYGNFTVTLKSDGNRIGTCGLYDREGMEGIDIGFAFLPEYGKKGYAFEAAYRIKRAASESYGINLLKAITAKGNEASQKLLLKLGFKKVGTTLLPGDNEELLLFECALDI